MPVDPSCEACRNTSSATGCPRHSSSLPLTPAPGSAWNARDGIRWRLQEISAAQHELMRAAVRMVLDVIEHNEPIGALGPIATGSHATEWDQLMARLRSIRDRYLEVRP